MPRPKPVAILASPHRRGHSAQLLSACLRGTGHARRHRLLHPPTLDIRPCRDCGLCRNNRPCPLDDSMPGVLALLRQAPCLIIASPVYFYGVPASFKSLIDRSQPLWLQRRAALNHPRPALLLATSGQDRPRGFEALRLEVQAFCHTINFQLRGEVLVPGVDYPGSQGRFSEALTRAAQLGRLLADPSTTSDQA